MSTNPLVSQLKSQHAELVQYLQSFGRTTPSSAKISEFAGKLMGHLGLEDSKLYPALIERGAVSKAVAVGFQTTLTALAKAATGFIEKWTKTEPNQDPKAFAAELALVTRDLGERIRQEEEMLYPMLK